MFKFLNGEVGGVTVFCARVAACTNERALNTAKGKQSIWLHQKCLQPGAPIERRSWNLCFENVD